MNDCHYYCEQRGYAICISNRVPSLSLHPYLIFLYVCVRNISGFDIKNADFDMVSSDYHPPFITDVLLPTSQLLHNQGPSYMHYASSEYLMLYESFQTVI